MEIETTTHTYTDDPKMIAKTPIEAVGEEERASIKIKAHVWKVGTLGSGGLRVVLNLDQEFIKEMAMLAECQHELIELEFVATAAALDCLKIIVPGDPRPIDFPSNRFAPIVEIVRGNDSEREEH